MDSLSALRKEEQAGLRFPPCRTPLCFCRPERFDSETSEPDRAPLVPCERCQNRTGETP